MFDPVVLMQELADEMAKTSKLVSDIGELYEPLSPAGNNAWFVLGHYAPDFTAVSLLPNKSTDNLFKDIKGKSGFLRTVGCLSRSPDIELDLQIGHGHDLSHTIRIKGTAEQIFQKYRNSKFHVFPYVVSFNQTIGLYQVHITFNGEGLQFGKSNQLSFRLKNLSSTQQNISVLGLALYTP